MRDSWEGFGARGGEVRVVVYVVMECVAVAVARYRHCRRGKLISTTTFFFDSFDRSGFGAENLAFHVVGGLKALTCGSGGRVGIRWL